MDPKLEKKVREIYEEMFEENYISGAPRIPPHTHNGIDNLPVASSGGGGTPGGNDTDIQFNNSGTFGGDDGFTYDVANQYVGLINVTNVPASDINIETDYADSTSNTHNIAIRSGNSTSNNSGNITLLTGDASTFNKVGDITIATGNNSIHAGQRGGSLTAIGGEVIIQAKAENKAVVIQANMSGQSIILQSNDSSSGFVGITAGSNIQIEATNGPLDLNTITDPSLGGGPIRINFASGQAYIKLEPDGGGLNGQITLRANRDIRIVDNTVLTIENATSVVGTPTGGGTLYVSAGALHYKGSGGTDTVIAPA